MAVVRLLGALLAAATLSLGLAACGEGNDAVEIGRTVTEPAQRPSVACRGPALKATGLPESFPAVEGVTFTRTQAAGPTQIVDGYLEGTLREGWQRYKAELRRAGYAVVFDEIEAQDSEVAYIGGGRTGQVALRALCRESGRVAVHVTSRPE
jgi:hypothetical protein